MSDRIVRKRRIRSKISGTKECPRVVVFSSNTHLYLQAIDDDNGVTLASASDLKPKDIAADLGKQLLAKKIKKIVFDRGGYQYHGKVKKLAEDLRSAGLEF